jgi:hypothetical protein
LFGGYCSREPDVDKTEKIGSKEAGYWDKSTCKLSPRECGSYKKFSEVVKPVEKLGSGVRIRKVGQEEIEELGGLSKPKVKCGTGRKVKEKPNFEQGALL